MTRRIAALAISLALTSGCMPRTGSGEPRSQELSVGAARFRILYWPGDESSAALIRRSLEKAAPQVERWGGLSQAVTVTIHPSHEALENAVQRRGYEWLKAWARYETIDVQSPRTWSLFGASEKKVNELVTHELTHCAMYQAAGSDLTWMYKEIPRWFSEGIASLTAGQGYRYGGVEELYAYYDQNLAGSGGGDPAHGKPSRAVVALPGDPIVDPDPLYQDQSHVVYGAAHHAAEFLVQRYGHARVFEVLRLMGTGLRFPAAFKEAIGLSDAEFAADFRRFVVWQGWRR